MNFLIYGKIISIYKNFLNTDFRIYFIIFGKYILLFISLLKNITKVGEYIREGISNFIEANAARTISPSLFLRRFNGQ